MVADSPRTGSSLRHAAVPWARADLPRVVVVDAQPATRGRAAGSGSVAAVLRAEHYEVVVVPVGRRMIEDVEWLCPDAVVVQHDSPYAGLARVCRQLSEAVGCRILVVAGADVDDDDETVISVLDAGADDYLPYPTTTPVFLARLRVALRAAPAQRASMQLVVGDVLIDQGAHSVQIDGDDVSMPPVRFALLASLARRANSIVRYDTLLEEVWGDRSSEAHPHRLRSAVSLLRTALGEGDRRPTIENVPHIGYRLIVGASPATQFDRSAGVA